MTLLTKYIKFLIYLFKNLFKVSEQDEFFSLKYFSLTELQGCFGGVIFPKILLTYATYCLVQLAHKWSALTVIKKGYRQMGMEQCQLFTRFLLLNFFPIQLTKWRHYTSIVQEVSLFPFLASFSAAFLCFTGCSKLNITFKLHNKDLGGMEWMRKVMGREVSAKIRFAKQRHKT